jgi:hypothetical protein
MMTTAYRHVNSCKKYFEISQHRVWDYKLVRVYELEAEYKVPD